MECREFLNAFIAHCNSQGYGSAYSQEEAVDGFLEAKNIPNRDIMPGMKGIIHFVWLMAEICDFCCIRKPEICAVKQTENLGLVPVWACAECSHKLKVGEELE